MASCLTKFQDSHVFLGGSPRGLTQLIIMFFGYPRYPHVPIFRQTQMTMIDKFDMWFNVHIDGLAEMGNEMGNEFTM